MKVLVCGGKDYKSLIMVCNELNKLDPVPTQLVVGDSRGADDLAVMWAREKNIPFRKVNRDNRHGNRAMFYRNIEMFEEKPDLVLAFPGSRGTEMMIALAEMAEIPVKRV